MNAGFIAGWNKLPVYSLCFLNIFFVVSAVYPWPYLLADGYHNHQRLMQVFSLLLLAVVCVFSVNYRNLFNKQDDKFVILGLSSLLFGGALSVAFAQSFFHSLNDYLHWCLLLILLASSAVWSGNNRCLLLLLGALAFAQALGVFTAVAYLCLAIFLGNPLDPEVIYPGVENIRTYNQIQIFVIPLLIFLLQHRRVGMVALVVILANFLLLFVGGARGAILALVLLLSLLWLAGWLRKRVYITIATFSIAGVLYGVLFYLQPEGMHDVYRIGSASRMEMWLEIMHSLKWHHLLWGIGPNGYVLFTDSFLFGHPHNSVLQLLLEWGGIALIGAGLAIGQILYLSFIHIKNHPEDELTQALLATLVVALVYSLVDGVIVMPIAQTLLFMFAGLLWGRVRNRTIDVNSVSRVKPNYLHTIVSSLGVLLIVVPFTWLTFQYYSQQIGVPEEVRGPRFWVNGAPFKLSLD